MAKKDPKLTAKKPSGTGATRLKFDNKPSIWPTDEAKKSNPALEEGKLFSKDALGSKIGTDSSYAAKSKKGFYNEKTFEHLPNEMLPTENY